MRLEERGGPTQDLVEGQWEELPQYPVMSTCRVECGC